MNPNDVLKGCKAIIKGLVLPSDLCTDHAHYAKNKRSTVLEKEQKHGGRRRDCVYRYYILVIRKFIDLMSLFRQCVVSLIFRCPQAAKRCNL